VRIAAISASSDLEDAADAKLGGLYDLKHVASEDPTVVRETLSTITADLLASTAREADAGAKIVVWPETGTRVLARDKSALLDRIGALAKQKDIYIDAGIGVYTNTEPYGQNQAILVAPTGQPVWTYGKAHPVPGLEPYTPGNGVVPSTDTEYGRLANAICYDADFPAMMRQPADIMLVPSDDWPSFGALHTQNTELRAIENGYTVVRPDMHGVAGAYDYHGRQLGSSDYFRTAQQTMVVTVPTRGARTVYSMIGDTFAWLCAAGFAGLALLAAGRANRRQAA
jgi:apolipoprotein N-acyltransferase